MVKKFLHI